ncbi:hypothetical protein AB1Y20_008651 [Prymnesium parvum]|uniref:Calmodulin-lysine N-methyltransferase n=1 Tax=Prymnesium parvum TaxID=97485 RepID=A0AB34ITU8_PRYPA
MWRGGVDSEGLPHGRGSLLDEDVRYDGRMRHGLRHGIGTLHVRESSDDEELSSLRVTWRDDTPDGRGTFTEPAGGSVHGCWRAGELCGAVREYHADGSLRFCGEYRCGVRDGRGVETRADGGCLAGEWRGGELQGSPAAFLYPCARGGALVGEWRAGRMHRARFCEVSPPAAARRRAAPPPLPAAVVHPAVHALLAGTPLASLVPRRDPRAPRYHRLDDAAAEGRQADPHEASRVRAGEDGEALFARRELRPREVVAFFGGVRCRASAADGGPPDGVDGSWGVRSADGWVWLPPALRSRDAYAASLAHKARYAGYRANCTLEPFEHPRLGAVLCMRTLSAAVKEGEELTVDGQHLVELPPRARPAWLRALLARRDEDGYYAHLQFTPPRQLVTRRSPRGGHRIHVEAHGPWRVLWFDGVEQGMTFHDDEGTLCPLVVGFDYQRTLAAAAAAAVLPSRRGCERVRVLFVGLGAGSCAAAVQAMGRGAVCVEAVEVDEAVVDVARGTHGVRIHSATTLPPECERAKGAPLAAAAAHLTARQSTKRPREAEESEGEAWGVRVVVADAAAYFAAARARSECVVLDAYDARGNVPAHLQTADFVRLLARSLPRDGLVLANLWHGSAHARASCERFARRLRSAVGLVFSLRVVGQESNIVLLAQKSATALSPETALFALRDRLDQGMRALEHVKEDALQACLRSNVRTLQLFEPRDALEADCADVVT